MQPYRVILFKNGCDELEDFLNREVGTAYRLHSIIPWGDNELVILERKD